MAINKRAEPKKTKPNKANFEPLNQTVRHFKDNGVDLDKYPMSVGPLLRFDSGKEVFRDNGAANEILHREYRKPFVCPAPGKV